MLKLNLTGQPVAVELHARLRENNGMTIGTSMQTHQRGQTHPTAKFNRSLVDASITPLLVPRDKKQKGKQREQHQPEVADNTNSIKASISSREFVSVVSKAPTTLQAVGSRASRIVAMSTADIITSKINPTSDSPQSNIQLLYARRMTTSSTASKPSFPEIEFQYFGTQSHRVGQPSSILLPPMDGDRILDHFAATPSKNDL